MGEHASDAASAAIADLIERYLAHLRRRGPGTTAATYGYQLRPFARWLAGRGVLQLGDLREHHLEEYQDALLARGLMPKSRSLAATALRSWFRWLMDRDLTDWRLLRAITTVRVPRGRAHPIPPDDLVQLLSFLGPRRPKMTVRQLRDRALFFYILATASRVSELLQVRRDEYADAHVVQKGGEEKRLRIPPTIQAMVQDYLAARNDDLPWLWVTNQGGRAAQLTPNAAICAWRRLARQLGMPRWTTHNLRDSSATWLALEGLPTHVIADHLGHANMQTVGKYIQVAEQQRGEVLEVMERLARRAPVAPARRWVKMRGRPDRRRKR